MVDDAVGLAGRWGRPRRVGASRTLWLFVVVMVAAVAVLGVVVWFGSAEMRRRRTPSARGVLLWKNGRYDEAMAYFLKALDADPGDVKSMRGVARCHIGKGGLRAAAEWAQRAIEIDGTPLARVLRAEIALKAAGAWEPVPGEEPKLTEGQRRHLEAAVEHATAAIQLDPNHGPAYRALAEATARLGDLRGAMAHIRRAIEVKPEGGQERLVAAELLLLQRNHAGALEHLTYILDHLDPKHVEPEEQRVLRRALRRAIEVELTDGHWDRALALCDRMAGLHFDREFVHVHRAWCYLGKDDPQKAVAEADRAERGAGRTLPALIYWVRGSALMRTKDYDRAITDFHTLATRQPENPVVHWRLAQALAASKRRGLAVDAYQKTVKVDPRLFGARIELADLLVEEGRFDDGLKLLRQGVDALQDDAPAYKLACQGLVDFCRRQGRSELAERELVRLLQLDPQSAELAVQLCSLYLDRGRAELALPLARHALRLRPSDVRVVHLLARAEAAGGQREIAGTRFAQAVRLDPRFQPAYLDWARLCQEAGRPAVAEDVFARARKALGSPVDVRIEHAKFRLGTRRAEEGLAELRAIVEADPRELAARTALVEHHLGHDLDAALAEATRAVEALPDSVPIHALLARVRRVRREWEPFLVELRAIATRLDADAFVCYQQLAGNVRLRRFEAAVAIGEDAARRHLGRARLVRLDLAIARFLAGQREQAMEEAQLAVGEDPTDGDAGMVLSLMRFLATGRPPSALACRQEAMPTAARDGWADFVVRARQHPDVVKHEAEALLEACVFEHAGWLDEAARRCAEALELVPDSQLLQALVPVLWERAGRRDEALATAKRAVEAAPARDTRRELLADLLILDGQGDRAAALYTVSPRAELPSLDPLAKRALLAMARGQTDEAIAAWRAVLRADARHVPACNNLAWLLATHPGGDLDEALRLVGIAQERAGGDPAVLDTAGWVHCQAGQHDKAVELLEQAVKAGPHRALYHFHLGMAYLRQGNTEEARRTLRGALDLNPTGDFAPEARQVLAGLGS